MGNITINVNRQELCRLMMACTYAGFSCNDESKKSWEDLHDKLKKTLTDFDEK